MTHRSIRRRASETWSNLRSRVSKDKSFYSGFHSGGEETIIYKAAPAQWDTVIPLLQRTIRKAIMESYCCEDDEFDHALRLIRQVIDAVQLE